MSGTSRYSESIIQKTRTLFSLWHLFSFWKSYFSLYWSAFFLRGAVVISHTAKASRWIVLPLWDWCFTFEYHSLGMWWARGEGGILVSFQKSEQESSPGRQCLTSLPAESEGRPPLDVQEQDRTLKSQHSLIVVIPQDTKVSKGQWRFLRLTFCTKPCHIRSPLLGKLHHTVHGAYNCWKFFSAQCDAQAWGLIRTYCIIKNISLTGLSKCTSETGEKPDTINSLHLSLLSYLWREAEKLHEVEILMRRSRGLMKC